MAIRDATPIVVAAEERTALEAWARAPTTEQRLVERARIVLLAADGWASRAIAREVGCARGVVSRWRVRFARDRLAGLADAPRSGKPRTYGEDAGRRILALLDRSPPAGFARWTAPLIAKELGGVSDQYVWRFLRAQRIDLAGRKSWCLSSDPEFTAKAAAIVGLYLAPPDHAIVLAVDEKPAIQALERAQGYLKLPNGRSLHGQAHEYKRHGNSTLFTALNVATGQIKAMHAGRRRRVEFLAFMNQVVADYPTRRFMSSSTTSRPTSPRAILGSPGIRTSTSTSPRPTPAGSTRSRSGSRSSPAAPSMAPASPRSGSCAKPSMPSSKRTTRPPRPSTGNEPRSIPKASLNGSRIYDSQY
jgi:transposase